LLVERRAGEELARSMTGQQSVTRQGAPQAPARWRFALNLNRR
jgi:hypothetical protein